MKLHRGLRKAKILNPSIFVLNYLSHRVQSKTNNQMNEEHLVCSDQFSGIDICRFSIAVTAIESNCLGDVFLQNIQFHISLFLSLSAKMNIRVSNA